VAATPAGAPSFPPRDADGRVATGREMGAGVAFWLVLGAIAVVLIDGIFTLFGSGSFGGFSGWVAGILVVWMFVEDFRGWRAVPARILVALVGMIVALALGVAANVTLSVLPPLAGGALGVTVASAAYAVLWFLGIRFVAGRLGEG